MEPRSGIIIPMSRIQSIEGDHHEQLDFEDENAVINITSRGSKRKFCKSKNDEGDNSEEEKDSNYSSSDDESASSSDTFDEGEMKSSGCSESTEQDMHSEEGEIQSDLEEFDSTVIINTPRDETPWERGLRLARERLERAKALKAKDKDLAEKRMTLSVPAPPIEEKIKGKYEEDVFWSFYYQPSIIGHTELTIPRYLPQDIQPPGETETAAWRASVTEHRHGRRGRSGTHRFSSRSGSSSGSTSSDSSVRSSRGSSYVSSLGSVAASWKATCAKAMRTYLDSPKHRRKYGSRQSSGSNSRSSDSGSGRSRSASRQGRLGYPTAAGGNRSSGVANRGRKYWGSEKYRTRPGELDSDQSSGSRSGSKSSNSSRKRFRHQNWKEADANSRQANINSKKSMHGHLSPSELSNSSRSPVRRRPDAPLLPNEKPIKRPWVAAPTLAVATAAPTAPRGNVQESERSRSSSRSRSHSVKPVDEKQFITSWSRSPSSGEGDSRHRLFRHERLPDVIPGPHIARTTHGSTMPNIRRRKSRSPFAEDANAPATTYDANDISYVTSENKTDNLPNQSIQTTRDEHRVCLPHVTSFTGASPTVSIGQLPSNRPGVRLTLAPRAKPTAVGINTLVTSVASRNSNRPFPSSPPTQTKSSRPNALPTFNRQTSPIEVNQIPPSIPANLSLPLMQNQVRLQAEAAAAALEARERRRAAAEAANRHRHPKRHKRSDLGSIPVRGRPTYRRQSFSNSSESSVSSKSSRSGSESRSRSASNRAPLLRIGSPISSAQSKGESDQRMPPPKRSRRDQQPANNLRSRGTEDSPYGRGHAQPLIRTGNTSLLPDLRDMPENRYRRQPEPIQRMGMTVGPNRNWAVDLYPPNPVDHKPHLLKRPYPLIEDDNAFGMRQRSDRDSRALIGQHPTNVFEEESHRVLARRSRAQIQPNKDRIVRPRTPHAEAMNINFNQRSPHADAEPITRAPRSDREPYRRVNYNIPEVPDRERNNSDQTLIESTNFYARRARSRHRSRGPGGAPIDRSEPFESDAGSFAAEQRLRKLRERLNLVDDAIAEIKASAGAVVNPGFNDSKR